MIIDDIKTQIKEGMKARDSAKTGLLRLILGQAQQDGDEGDKNVEAIIRKMIKNNNQTAESMRESGVTEVIGGSMPAAALISAENDLMETFIPKSMTVGDIKSFISDNDINVQGAPNQGAAMGLVMKALKSSGATVQGSDVKTAVSDIFNG